MLLHNEFESSHRAGRGISAKPLDVMGITVYKVGTEPRKAKSDSEEKDRTPTPASSQHGRQAPTRSTPLKGTSVVRLRHGGPTEHPSRNHHLFSSNAKTSAIPGSTVTSRSAIPRRGEDHNPSSTLGNLRPCSRAASLNPVHPGVSGPPALHFPGLPLTRSAATDPVSRGPHPRWTWPRPPRR